MTAKPLTPLNKFADLLARRGIDLALCNAYAKAFRQAGSAERRQRIIDRLDLSHPMTGMALYGDDAYPEGVR